MINHNNTSLSTVNEGESRIDDTVNENEESDLRVRYGDYATMDGRKKKELNKLEEELK